MYLHVQISNRTKVSLQKLNFDVVVCAEQLMQIRYENSHTPIRRSLVGETQDMISMKEKKKLDDKRAKLIARKERRMQRGP